MSDASLKIETKGSGKPLAEIHVEGELSPFEHEALYQLLRKHFRVEQPTYAELQDENVSTRLTIIFHNPYYHSFFADIFRNDWRNLKELFKQISYRRGGSRAGFTISFIDTRIASLAFSLGTLTDDSLGSAMDQIAHLPAIIGQIISPDKMEERLDQVVAFFDPGSDRWYEFRGVDSTGKKEYVFDETSFRWKTPDPELQSRRVLSWYYFGRK